MKRFGFFLGSAFFSASLANAQVKGEIKIDGSSTVFPLSVAISEEFQKAHRDIRVSVGKSGTNGGFKKFARGEIAITNASQPIEGEYDDAVSKANIKALELKVAWDGLTVVVSKKNTFLNKISMEELKTLWNAGSKVDQWSKLNPAYPKEAVKLYGPGSDSGTFEFFTALVNGEKKKSRTDYSANEDDNMIVRGVAGSPFALGYFGYNYYVENKNELKALKIESGKKVIEPSNQTIADGTYPLKRPLFFYVNKEALKRPEVQAYFEFLFKDGFLEKMATEVGMTPLSAKDVAASKELWLSATKAK